MCLCVSVCVTVCVCVSVCEGRGLGDGTQTSLKLVKDSYHRARTEGFTDRPISHYQKVFLDSLQRSLQVKLQ